jgi:hypothetical protein
MLEKYPWMSGQPVQDNHGNWITPPLVSQPPAGHGVEPAPIADAGSSFDGVYNPPPPPPEFMQFSSSQFSQQQQQQPPLPPGPPPPMEHNDQGAGSASNVHFSVDHVPQSNPIIQQHQPPTESQPAHQDPMRPPPLDEQHFEVKIPLLAPTMLVQTRSSSSQTPKKSKPVTSPKEKESKIKQIVLTPKQKEFRKRVEKVVKHILKSYLRDGRIGNEDDMKHLCKKLAYQVMKKEHGNTKMSKDTPKKIEKYIKAYFTKHSHYTHLKTN